MWPKFQTLGWCCTVVCRVLPALEFWLWQLGLQETKLLWYKIEKYSLGKTTSRNSVTTFILTLFMALGSSLWTEAQEVTKPGRQQHPISNLMRQIKICFQLKEGFGAGSEVRTSWWAEALFVWSSLWRQSHPAPEVWWKVPKIAQCPHFIPNDLIQPAQCPHFVPTNPGLPGSGCADGGTAPGRGNQSRMSLSSFKVWDSLAAGLCSCTS